jgi:hypothetical protein
LLLLLLLLPDPDCPFAHLLLLLPIPKHQFAVHFPHRNSPRTPIAKYTCTIRGEKEGNSNKLTIATIIPKWDVGQEREGKAVWKRDNGVFGG